MYEICPTFFLRSCHLKQTLWVLLLIYFQLSGGQSKTPPQVSYFLIFCCDMNFPFFQSSPSAAYSPSTALSFPTVPSVSGEEQPLRVCCLLHFCSSLRLLKQNTFPVCSAPREGSEELEETLEQLLLPTHCRGAGAGRELSPGLCLVLPIPPQSGTSTFSPGTALGLSCHLMCSLHSLTST